MVMQKRLNLLRVRSRIDLGVGKLLVFAALLFFVIFYLLQYDGYAWDNDKALVVATAASLDDLDPSSMKISKANVVSPLFETLIQAGDKRGQYSPKLAEKWNYSPDDQVWHFSLRHDVLYHDGRTLKAEDVVRSFKRPQVEKIFSSLNIKFEIEAVDEFTVQFKLKQPVAYFLDLIAWPCMAVVKEDEDGKLWGTGPFVVEEFRPHNRLSLRTFEQYWQESAAIKRLIFIRLDEESYRRRELKRLNVDVALDIDNLGNKENFAFMLSPSWKRTFLTMNCKHRPFNETKGRIALQCSLNKKELVNKFFPDTYWACADYVAPDNWACGSNVRTYDYNIALAKRIFQKSEVNNIDNYVNISMLTSKVDSDRRRELGRSLCQELKKSGLRLKMVEIKEKELETVLKRGLYELALLTEEVPCVDPGLELELNWGQRTVFDSFINIFNFESNHILTLLDKARLESDEEQRKIYYVKVQDKLNESVALYNIAWCHRKDGVSKKVRNWKCDRFGVVHFEKLSME